MEIATNNTTNKKKQAHIKDKDTAALKDTIDGQENTDPSKINSAIIIPEEDLLAQQNKLFTVKEQTSLCLTNLLNTRDNYIRRMARRKKH